MVELPVAEAALLAARRLRQGVTGERAVMALAWLVWA